MPSLLLIGCGHMGSALLGGWLARGPENISYQVFDPVARPSLQNPRGLPLEMTHKTDVLKPADLIVLAVKPQQFESLGEMLRAVIRKDTIVISIVAGVSVETISAITQTKHIIRTMPNLPAAVGQGMTGLYSAQQLSASLQALISALFESVGGAIWLENEAMMNAITAAAGSGPGFFYYMLEVYQQAVMKLGFDKNMAKQLTLKTALGSLLLAAEDPVEFSVLRERVTSPKGTTEAGLAVLMNSDLPDVLEATLARATARAEELSK